MSCSTPACPPTNVKFQLRRATAHEWTTRNPVLRPGEPGVETDTGQMKIGNETCDRWINLPYVGTTNGTGITGPTGASGTVGATGATGPIRKGYYTTFKQVIRSLSEGTGLILTSTDLSGLDLSIGNSVIIQNLDNTNTQFEGIISNYDSVNGTITLRDITNIFGSGYGSVLYTWLINLSGPRGTKFFSSSNYVISRELGRIGDYYLDQITGELYLRQ